MRCELKWAQIKEHALNPLSISAATDFILAFESLYFAGVLLRQPKARFSAAWFWSGAMALLGLAALLAGIDHGWFEAQGLSRYFIQRSTWIVLGVVTFFIWMTTATQCFSPVYLQVALILGLVQFACNTLAALLFDSYLVVILNYMPVMLLWLAMNIAGLRKGTGSRYMIAGILTLFLATGLQVAQVDVFSPVDHNALYHLVSMVGVVALFQGGRRLRTVPPHVLVLQKN